MSVKTPRFEGPFKWSALRQQLLSLREDIKSVSKVAGRHITIDEHRGKGKVINASSDASRRPSGSGATGACCVGTDCSIQTADDCAGMGGTYQGDDTTCDPNPCGACPCYGTVSISVELAVDDTSTGCSFHASRSEDLVVGDFVDECSAGWGPFEFIYPEYINGQIYVESVGVAGGDGSPFCYIISGGVCGAFAEDYCGSGYVCFNVGDEWQTGGPTDGCVGTGCPPGGATFTWVMDGGTGLVISATLTIS